MTLLPDERQVLDDLIAEAWDDHGPFVRDVAVALVGELNDLAGSGVEWVAGVLDDWLVTGAMSELKSWMRRQPAVVGKTKRGAIAEVPAFGGVRVKDAEDHVVHVQMRLLDMTRDELLNHIGPKRKQRDTMSRSLSFYQSVADDMEAHGHARVADALECIGLDDVKAKAS